MFNPNWYYNPACFNQQTYAQLQAQQYEHSQQKDVARAVNSYRDLLNAVGNLDSAHQEIVFWECLAVFAARNHW